MTINATATFTPHSPSGRFAPANIDATVLEATSDVGQIALAEAQALCPVDTGFLRDSGHSEVVSDGKTAIATVEFDAPYASYVEYGTGIRGESSPGAGPYPYNPNWPGQAAQPFVRPALDNLKSEMLGEFALRMRQ
jgi:HK97 gp10 family phage protein